VTFVAADSRPVDCVFPLIIVLMVPSLDLALWSRRVGFLVGLSWESGVEGDGSWVLYE
jgi:hypothetical protein